MKKPTPLVATKYSWKYWQPTSMYENLSELSTMEYMWYKLIVDEFHLQGFSF